jgi:hypothetical protein
MPKADSVHITPPANTSSETPIDRPQRLAGERLAQLAAQEVWAGGSRTDLEVDASESGIGDGGGPA